MSIQDVSWKEIVDQHKKLNELGKRATREIQESIERSDGAYGSFHFPPGNGWLHYRKKTDPGYYLNTKRKDSKDMQFKEHVCEEGCEGHLPSLNQLKEWEDLTKDEGY